MTLPAGFTVTVADGHLANSTGDVLVGGSPLTAVRLGARARQLMDQGRLTVTDAASARLVRRLLATNLAAPDLTRSAAVSPADLTVVIPVRDRADQLARALAGLSGLICLVVDDASVNRAAVAAVCARSAATYLPLDRNVGPAAARNVGLELVRTPFVAFVDSDVEVGASDLLALARHFADPEVALVGPKVVGRPTRSRPRWFERYDAYASSLTLGERPSNVRPGAAVGWLPSACLVARTDALGAGFDPTMRVGEDVDLVWRLVGAGHGVRYEPGVVARHDSRSTVRAWLGRKFVYGTGGAALAARHGRAVAPAVLAPAQAMTAAALLTRERWSPLAAVASVAWTGARVRARLPGDGGTALAVRIAVRGLGWAVRQESALAARHWWPIAFGAACVSRRARRALVSGVLVDSVLVLAAQRDRPERINPGLLLVGRRLDDLAYGAGLWWGALRSGSPVTLLPRRPVLTTLSQGGTVGACRSSRR